ncbi:MAG: AAA domain-containing protein [bacterium]|nr:AAA domain-containing protein [bacterium]
MRSYRQKFDAKAYWENKPLCTVCKQHKVKSGTVCYKCKKLIEKNNLQSPKVLNKKEIISKISKENMQQSDTKIETPDNNFGVDVSAKTQNKIVRLFTYLEKALALDDTIVRDFRSSMIPPSPWWLADYPRDLDNLFIREFDMEKEMVSPESGAWLRVQKKNIEPAPVLPEKLAEWIIEVNPLDKPKPLEKIDRKVRFDSDKESVNEFKKFRKDFKQGDSVPKSLLGWVVLAPNKLPEAIEVKYVPDNWTDHPELEKLLIGYIENEWKRWADKVNKIYKANLLYDQFYALRLLLKNEGDSHELLLGHGFLTWKHPSVGAVYAPIFFTPLTLDFDASKRTIEINPDPLFRSFVEIAPVSEMDNPADIDLDKWMGTVNSNPFDFWHLETLKSQANTFLNYLSPDGEDHFTDEGVSAPALTDKPSVWNAPIIFVRKRTNSLWSKYAETIKRGIEQNGAKSTEFINDLIGEYEEGEDRIGLGESGKETDIAIKESELFFPLPWNDEQKRIAERIETNYGVVVKGPPGTGKSHTIANLIARFLAQGKSVLVTSQTSKALEVLRDKLPENIRSLAVSQLHQTAKRDDVLQQSITEISSNLGERRTKFSEQKAELVRKELASVREQKASIANLIRQYILTDSTQTLRANGGDATPIEAAKFISEHDDNRSLAWFTDEINFDTELNFTAEDLKQANQLLTDLSKENRSLHKFDLPDSSSLPNDDVILGAFASYRELSVKAKISNNVFGNSGNDFNQEELLKLWEMLNNARKVLVAINENYERDIFNTCNTSQSEREKWKTILSKISEKIQIIGKSRNMIIGHDISGSIPLSLNECTDAINSLKTKVSNGSKLGTFGKMLLSADAKKILGSYLVDGRCPDSFERIELLESMISAQVAEKDIKILLDQGFGSLNGASDLRKDNLDLIKLEVLVASANRIACYYDNFTEIAESFKRVKQFADLSFTQLESIETARELIASSVAQFELSKLEATFQGWVKLVDDPIGNRHGVCERLIQAIEKRNNTAWKKAIEELDLLIENKDYAIRLNEIAERINKHAPNLYQDMIGLADQKQKFDCPDNLELVWKIARLKSWIDHIHDHVSIDELQSKHERLSKLEFQLNSDLVTVLAWQKQIDKVTKRQRDALMAWSDSMRKYGKGTGKWAHKHLSAAQESLREAKNAVPVWIMPLHRAAQMFSDPKAGMFDVVIFDEASQCDIRGLTIGYLGKKLLVVGDPDQISPAGIFQDQERVYELISRFLYDIPHKDNFSITSSLFGLAQIRIPNMIQLNEHFRCVPEIIAFSNHHVYEGKLKPLRYPHPKGLLKPALVPVLVEGGYQNTNNKVNEPEAKAIVDKIAELLENPNYQQRPDGHICTFGVISLLAEDQAKYIKELLLRHPKIGEKVIEERDIVCGDAYAFQGDERDVMFLSMVKALDSNNPNDTVKALADKGTAQRFNVAATRGRDQVFLYHSIPVQEFRNQNDWRYKILNWYYDPKTEELEAGRKALKKEFDSGRASQFSFDVGNLLIDRGYQVLPEYPVIGYRIDLVVQGENARLAVECDGDQYHTLENWEEDQVRERQLRRAGWEFWRVSGSSFYRHKEKALDSLWEKLKELEIKPII